CEAFVINVNFRRKYLEAITLVIQQRDRVADDHVRELADGFANDLIARGDFGSSQDTRNANSDFWREVQDDAALNVALDRDEGGDTFAAIGVLFHRKIADLSWPVQRFGENRIRSVDERLNEFHSHERCSPARATGAPAALGSSLKT